jgi:Putative cyclase
MPEFLYPKFEDLQARKTRQGRPQYETWELFPDSSLGRLSLLTPDKILRAKQLVQTGQVVNLDWTTNKPTGGCFARGSMTHKIHHFPLKDYGVVIDDSFEFNSQSGSQWDGLWHFAYQETGQFYGGRTIEDIIVPEENRKGGMASWADHGIIGRGVLLDIYSWYRKHNQGKVYDPFTSHAITVDDLLSCANEQGVVFEVGDILIIRSGYTLKHDRCDVNELDKMRENKSFAGVEQSEEMKAFLHDNYFAAVAGDAPSFEVMPPQKSYFLHEYLLACWGIPIGEFWYLEELAEICEKEQRWDFMLTSKVLNVPGGIASPPNAMAIF